MTRHIDADALYEKVAGLEEMARDRYLDTTTCLPNGGVNPSAIRYIAQMDERTAFKHMIADAPTVDAMPVIRCKDCKHFGKPACPMVFSLPIKSEQRTSGWVETFRNGADDYCSRAERKEE